MNKEEKEAIEYLKYSCTDDCLSKEFIVKPILNYIDKLQKENEDMREELQMYVDTPINKLIVENEELKDSREVLSKEILSDKATIVLFKEKIDKLQKENEELHKQVDIEFVEENYIEKSKVISKNKIRNKIKEVQEKDIDYCKYAFSVNEWKDFAIDKLNELLGESNE